MRSEKIMEREIADPLAILWVALTTLTRDGSPIRVNSEALASAPIPRLYEFALPHAELERRRAVLLWDLNGWMVAQGYENRKRRYSRLGVTRARVIAFI